MTTHWLVKDKADGSYLCPLNQGWSKDRGEALRFADKRQSFDVAGALWGMGCQPTVMRVTRTRPGWHQAWVRYSFGGVR